MSRGNPTIIVAGSVAQKSRQGGHTWVFLQYLLGLKRLGYEVLLLDRLEPDMYVSGPGPEAPDASTHLHYLREVMKAFGLDDAWAVGLDRGRSYVGMSRAEVMARVADSAALINVMGYIDDPELLDRAPCRVFFDIDPGFGQMWCALGLHNPYEGYHHFVTVGANVGRPGCVVPTCGRTWIPSAQPVVLDLWPESSGRPDGAFTSVGAWRGPYGPVEYEGRTYGLRVHEARKFVELPGLTGERFELALDIDPADARDSQALIGAGWSLVAPSTVAFDPWSYQRYLAASKAELMIAKNMYVQSRCGWFSDRSICYLASGRPVVAQDTGLADLYPTGRGLLTFSTQDEATAAVDSVRRDYVEHCHAARRLAREHFDSDIVLPRLLGAIGVA